MKKLILFVLCLALSIGSTAWGADSVKKNNGQSAVSGALQGMTATEVTILKTGGTTPETIPVADIDAVFFDGEPPQLRVVRNYVGTGSYVQALSTLSRSIDAAAVADKPNVKAEVEFLKAYCEAKQALGAGGANLKAAGTAMFNFVKNNPNNYHFLQANEVLGDLLVAAGDFETAKKSYEVLEKSPFPEYKARAAIAKGRGLLSQNKGAEALASFDEAIKQLQGASGPAIEGQRFTAMLGKAACLADQNQADQGIALVEESIKGLNPEASDVLAQAYVTLGKCYEKKGAKKEALRAYLHVDLLYSTHPQSHVEALKRLAVLWNDLGKPERALQQAQILKDRYDKTVGGP